MSYITGEPIQCLPKFKFCRRMMMKQNPPRLLFTEECEEVNDDAIKVFLRLKPSSTHDNNNAIEIIDSRTVIFKMPEELTQHKRKLNAPTQTRYVFSKIFPESSTQSEVYRGCVAPLIKEVFAGRHCLLFTYGTTNAGKTFTVLGNGDHPGIIPRTLTTIFKSIKGKEYRNPQIMPHKFKSVIDVTDETLQKELDFKQKLITSVMEKSVNDASRLQHKSYTSHTTTMSTNDEDIIGDSVFKEMQRNLLQDTSIVEFESLPDDRFSVWVSFAEIYNEATYDLLNQRKLLQLTQDERKNTYIKDLKYVNVENEEDAFRVLRFGKSNLQVAATGLNNRSSRSHCIFSIKLLKCANVKHPTTVDVSSFSICDLAGAERQKKTLNVGDRLKESRKINGSLHVLSRCFNIIRENQVSNEQKLVPYRDSKLTQLFKHALQGKETVTMVTNVNSDLNLSEETNNVLKASAIAKCIVVLPKPAPKVTRNRTSMFSQLVKKQQRSTLIRWDSCVKPSAPNEQHLTKSGATPEEISELDKNEEQHLNLLALVEDVREKLKEEKKNHKETKQKLNEVLIEKYEIANQTNDNRLGSRIDEVTVGVKKRKLDGSNYVIKIDHQEEGFGEELQKEMTKKIKDFEEEIETQQKQIESLTGLVNSLREDKKELMFEIRAEKMKSGIYEGEKRQLEANIKKMEKEAGIEDLRKEMDEKVKVRDHLLTEAREDIFFADEECKSLELQVEKLEADLAKMHIENDDLNKEIEDIRGDVYAARNDVENHEQKVYELEYEIEEMNKRIEDKDKQIVEKDEKIAALKEELDLKQGLSLELQKEVDILQQSLKQQIQETSRVTALQCEKMKENERIRREMVETRALNEELQQTVNSTQHKLECSESKIKGLESSLPVLEYQLNDYKELLQVKQAATNNLEQEKESIQANYKEIITKYEEQLKKRTEECEGYKKEVGRLVALTFKSSPTPKKLQNENESLKKQVECLKKENRCLHLQQQNEAASIEKAKENECTTNIEYIPSPVNHNLQNSQQSPDFVKKQWRNPKSEGRRRRSKSTNDYYDLKAECAKSVKTPLKVHQSGENGMLTSLSGQENEPRRTKKRHQLFDASASLNCEEVQFVNIAQNSPSDSVKRTLRPRNK